MIDACRIDMIFLDDGGVMNDNTLRSAEWRRLVGEYLTPRLGGSAEAWGAANQVVFEEQWERFEEWQRQQLAAGEYGEFFDSAAERERWLREMCERVGVVAPRSEECVALARETEEYVAPRVRAAFHGAVDAVRALRDQRYTLSTASGSLSKVLERNLTGLGVRECFSGHLYGSDIAQAHKSSALYYRRIFAHAGIEPQRALVVDDSPLAAGLAREAGANVVLVGSQAEGLISIAQLADLPAMLGI